MAIRPVLSSRLVSRFRAAISTALGRKVTISVPPSLVVLAPSLSTSSPKVGIAVTATVGLYTGSPTVTRQWFYGDTGAPIAGATGIGYTPVSADIGHPLKYIETATTPAGSIAGTAAVTSAITSAIPLFAAAVAGVKAGTHRAIAMVIGDSTTLGEAGSAAGSANSYDGNVVQTCWAAVMANTLAAGGVSTCNAGFWGDGGCANYNDVAYNVFNPQLVTTNTGGAYARSSGNQTLGGGVWNIAGASGNTAGYFTFAPQVPVTKFRTFLIQSAYGYGVYNQQIDSNAAQAVTVSALPSGQNAVAELDVSGLTKGVHTLSMNRSSGGNLFLLGGYAYDETTPAVDVLIAGNRGSATADWSTDSNPSTPWGAYDMIDTIKPNLTIITPPINDWASLSATDRSQDAAYIAGFTSRLQTIVTKALKWGDVMIANAGATNANGTTHPPESVRQAFTAAMQQVIAINGLPPLIDLEAASGPWTSTGWRDDYHAFQPTYAKMGRVAGQQLLSLIG